MIGVIFALVLPGCNGGGHHEERKQLTPEESEAVKSEIKALMAVVIEGLETNDPDKLFRDFWRSDSASFYLNGMAMQGYDEIIGGFSQGMESRQNTKMTLSSEEIVVLDRDAAMHLAEFTNSMVLTNDSTMTVKGYWSAVFKKINEQWKVVHVHESFNPAP
ncbi:YybH family protein [Robertkochia sediminum]|uniref:YybH family protein n=1 Tax=Robertkochia sediminum TaxID=2785326 RepID=UPI00193227FC|nr:AtzH-like domain-containing protein [Robertkochia sediminum]MBL7473985.1 DUF3225 domain-containing protein [Robertkochia sediminum]